MRFRSKPVEIEAIQFTGNNGEEVTEFAESNFYVLDEEAPEDPEATAAVFDKIHSTWILVYDTNWIIRGTKGEYYPCDAEVFYQKYELIDD